MVQFRGLLVASIIAVAYATPIRRINQITSDSTAKWEQACLAAGGAQQCNPISIKAFGTLLAAGGNCDQQNAADDMIDLAKKLDSDADMIRLSQIFVQQPRNSPDKLQVPYCQTAPRNAELNGLFHCQFAGSDFTKFSGDQTGNLPLGVKAVTPPGSCPAKPDGPVPDGVQLNTLVNTPRPAGAAKRWDEDNVRRAFLKPHATGTAKAGHKTERPHAAAATPKIDHKIKIVSPHTASKASHNTKTVKPHATATPKKVIRKDIRANPSFAKSNGQEAEALNAQFAELTTSSSCEAGEQACVNNEFAQCVGGKFALTPCAGGTICAALPLVNKPGTSITCTTAADRDARIAATGAKRSAQDDGFPLIIPEREPQPHTHGLSNPRIAAIGAKRSAQDDPDVFPPFPPTPKEPEPHNLSNQRIAFGA